MKLLDLADGDFSRSVATFDRHCEQSVGRLVRQDDIVLASLSGYFVRQKLWRFDGHSFIARNYTLKVFNQFVKIIALTRHISSRPHETELPAH